MNVRKATKQDLPEIVRMLADDVLGSKRESYQDLCHVNMTKHLMK